MVTNFYNDLRDARYAEYLVLNTFATLAPDYTFTNMSNDRAWFHKGDIKAVGADGHEVSIEVKDDSRIASTGNILCEEAVDYWDTGLKEGNMYNDYEIYCVVSQQAQRIVVIDFDVLRAHYKEGQFKKIPHYEQTTHAYLMPITRLIELGAIIAIVDYGANQLTYKRPE